MEHAASLDTELRVEIDLTSEGAGGETSGQSQDHGSVPGRVLVIVPAFDEADSISATLAALRHCCPWADVVVIDDGSSDGTGSIAAALGCPVVRLPFNLGIGGAVQTGFQYASARDYVAVVQFDGDGQHPADQVAELVRPVLEGAYDVVVGSRFLNGTSYHQTAYRSLGGWILRHLISGLTRQPITDPTSGFRAYSIEVVRNLGDDYPYDYPEPEALVQLHRSGFTFYEIPVQMQVRQGGQSSIGAWVAARYMAKVVLAITLSALRAKPKARAERRPVAAG